MHGIEGEHLLEHFQLHLIGILNLIGHSSMILRLYHAHSLDKCEFPNGCPPGYCSRIVHSVDCKPVQDIDIARRQCKMALTELAFEHPNMTPAQIRAETIVKEKQTLLPHFKGPDDRQFDTLPLNAEIIFGKTSRNLNRQINYVKAGFMIMQF